MGSEIARANDGDTPLSTSLGRIAPLFAQAHAAGLDVGAELAALDLPRDLADHPSGQRLSLADYYRIQNRIARRLGDETCQMSPRHLAPGSTDLVLANVEGCANLYEVMQVIARSYNVLHGGEYNFVKKKKDSVDYVIDDASFPYTVENDSDYVFFSIECVLIFLHCILMMVAPKSAAEGVKSLSIRRPKGGGQLRHLSYWRAPVRFGAPNYRVRFDRELALAPLPAAPKDLTSNALYLKIVEVVSARRSPWARDGKTVSAVRDALSHGVIEQNEIALRIGVSVATLRRRLSDEGANFRTLRRDALNEAAKEMLANSRSIHDVAEELGFSEFRSFNRAFKEWNGVTPKRFQDAVRGGERPVERI